MYSLLFLTFLVSCTSYRQIGNVNMISKRNVSLDKEYRLIESYAGSSSDKEIRREARKAKSKSIDAALYHTVSNVAGGEFVMNAKIYLVNDQYFVVRGDVWGLTGNVQHKGWKVGDIVQWREFGQTKKGFIVNLKDDDNATVQEVESGRLKVIEYSKLLKE